MRIFIISLAVALIALGGFSCVKRISQDNEFETTAGNFIEEFLRLNPTWATSLGDHRYDNLMPDYSAEGRDAERVFYHKYLDSLAMINPDRLSQDNRVDYEILKAQIESWTFALDTLREWEWNPRSYGVGDAIYSLLARDFAPLEERLVAVAQRFEQIPGVLEEGKKALKHPPAVFTETAIRQNEGTIALIRDEINVRLEEFPALADRVKPAQEAAIKALEDWGVWLKDDLLPRSDGDFRLGPEKYKAKLGHTLNSEFTTERILEMAETELVKTQEALYETALPLMEKYFPGQAELNSSSDAKGIIKKVLDRLADDHPTSETVVDLAKVTLTECEDFIRENDLFSMPDEPIEIIVMPEFQRGVAIAYCDSPGPFEKDGKTFYAISPPPQDMSEELKESGFREDNNYMLRDLTAHEAIPGHYLQLAHANKFQSATNIRSIFGSDTFIEGWACYAEQLMAEHGFGGPEVKMQQLKMWLRVVTNAIIDQKIHAGNMTEEEAVKFMMEEGFQEEAAARGKWRRAILTSTQLSTYFVGNIGVREIRRAYEARHSGDVDLKAMHDEMLSYGSPPSKYIKMLMGL